MKENKSEQDQDRSYLGQAYDAVKGEVRQIRTDVAEELQTYAKVGKFRLATGFSLAAKGALLGSVVPGKGTILGGATGFVVGIVGAPRIEKQLERWVPDSVKGKLKESVIRWLKPEDQAPVPPVSPEAPASENISSPGEQITPAPVTSTAPKP